jgi:hypothetical protein
MSPIPAHPGLMRKSNPSLGFVVVGEIRRKLCRYTAVFFGDGIVAAHVSVWLGMREGT